MTALNDLTITAALAGLDKGDFSARELTEVHLSAMALQHGLNAFITETPDKARAMAAASDERRREGKVGLLEGIPLGIKDLFCTEGVLTTAGSHILDGFKPPYESTVTARLWQAGAVMLGKLNMDEFAMGSSNTTSYHGSVKNPWKRRGENRDLVPGGSSGGSVAAVAARVAMAARHRGLCLLPRSGGTGCPHGGGRGLDASGHGRPRPEGFDGGGSAGAGLSRDVGRRR